MAQDLKKDIGKHIESVTNLIGSIILNLVERSARHDRSKYSSDEFVVYEEAYSFLSVAKYPSDEYNQVLERLRPALILHYRRNSHHPEHFEEGINGMSLLDVLEMLCDWRAAWERKKDVSFRDVLIYNKKRFNIEHGLYLVICNTAVELGWIPSIPAE